jgi:hypothetical protein
MMSLKGTTVLVAAFLGILLLNAQPGAQTFVSWENHARGLPQFWDAKTQPVEIRSPDGRLSLQVSKQRTGKHYPEDVLAPEYYITKQGKRLSPSIEPFSVPSALWSPSSEKLAIQSTEGGAVGTWSVKIYTVRGGTVSEREVGVEVRSDLAKKYPAGINPDGAEFFSQKDQEAFARDVSWVNVIGCGWLTNPERLVVVAGVPASSRYGKNMGREVAYILEPLTGHIMKTYPSLEARRKWPQCISDR